MRTEHQIGTLLPSIPFTFLKTGFTQDFGIKLTESLRVVRTEHSATVLHHHSPVMV
jgi:hypothetical protein